MYVVVRKYSGAGALADAMERSQPAIEELLRGVPGFVAYYAVRSPDGVAGITVCDDRAGTTESTKRAAAWVKENLPDVWLSPPEVTEGEAFLEIHK